MGLLWRLQGKASYISQVVSIRACIADGKTGMRRLILPALNSVAVNSVAIALAFVLALVWIILSAVRHSAATTHCVDQFITNSDANTTTSTDGSLVKVSADTVNGHTLCSIFTWVQLGVMGGLWIALVILEFYFAMMSRIYGTEQRQDHKRYNRLGGHCV